MLLDLRHVAAAARIRDGIKSADPSLASSSQGGGSAGSISPPTRNLRGESGQGAVEFALIVPFICAILLILVDFGKAMNYALDLTQVANEGARHAAVNDPAVTEDWIRGRLKSWELRDGNPANGADRATITICVVDAGDDGEPGLGDPVQVDISSRYKWFDFPDWLSDFTGIDSPAATTIHGRATMRIETATTGFGTC